MSDKKITIKIDPLGNPTVEAHGFNGVGCEDATRTLEEALAGGDGNMTRVIKDEWSNADTEVAEEQVKW